MQVSAGGLRLVDCGLRVDTLEQVSSPPVCPKGNIAIACHPMLCLSVSHRMPFLPSLSLSLSLSVCVCQRVKELDQALLAADQQYAALLCSVADRKAVLSVEELQQLQASICCP